MRKAAQMAADWWAERLRQGDREAFRADLAKRIDAALDDHGIVFTENDYDPQGILLESVRAIGIECRGFMFSGKGIFPDKHALDVTERMLTPKEGYGNWTAEIPVTAE